MPCPNCPIVVQFRNLIEKVVCLKLSPSNELDILVKWGVITKDQKNFLINHWKERNGHKE
jgi:hypothetical protein